MCIYLQLLHPISQLWLVLVSADSPVSASYGILPFVLMHSFHVAYFSPVGVLIFVFDEIYLKMLCVSSHLYFVFHWLNFSFLKVIFLFCIALIVHLYFILHILLFLCYYNFFFIPIIFRVVGLEAITSSVLLSFWYCLLLVVLNLLRVIELDYMVNCVPSPFFCSNV